MPMIKNQQLGGEEGAEGRTAAAQCSSLAASSPHRQGPLPLQHLLSTICDKTLFSLPPLLPRDTGADSWQARQIYRPYAGRILRYGRRSNFVVPGLLACSLSPVHSFSRFVLEQRP
jgi:hypothetical protein